MDKESMTKLVDMFKSGKIIVNEEGNLSYSKEYLNKQQKRKITKVNKDKNKRYSNEGIKLSEKVYFTKLKSGELRLRGGRKNAVKFNNELKIKMESKRIGEKRRELYYTLSGMIDKYVQNLEKKANQKEEKVKKKTTIKKTASKPEEIREIDTKKDSTKISSKKEQTTVVVKGEDKERKIDLKEKIFSNIPSSESEKYTYFSKIYDSLDTDQKYEIKLLFLGKDGLINKIKAKIPNKRLERKLISRIKTRYDVLYTLVGYAVSNANKGERPSDKKKSKLRKKYNELSFRSRYKLKLMCLEVEKGNVANILEKIALYLPNKKREEKVLDDIFSGYCCADEFFAEVISGEEKKAEQKRTNKEKRRAMLESIDARSEIKSRVVNRGAMNIPRRAVVKNSSYHGTGRDD